MKQKQDRAWPHGRRFADVKERAAGTMNTVANRFIDCELFLSDLRKKFSSLRICEKYGVLARGKYALLLVFFVFRHVGMENAMYQACPLMWRA